MPIICIYFTRVIPLKPRNTTICRDKSSIYQALLKITLLTHSLTIYKYTDNSNNRRILSNIGFILFHNVQCSNDLDFTVTNAE